MTERIDLDELREAVTRAEAMLPALMSIRVADLRALIAELTELRQERAGGWVSPIERMPKVGDSVVAIGLEDEPLAGKVGPHWRTADDLLLNTATGEGYSFEHVALWMLLPNPQEATDG